MNFRRTIAIASALLALTAVVPATAAPEVVNDSQGRAINFDVQAPGVDVAGYASVLDGALHGDEISNVTVRVVAGSQIRSACGAGAAACYRWSSVNGETRGATIIVAAQPPQTVASALIHEYGHHIDNSYRHRDDARGLDGTAGWWQAREMSARLSAGEVRWDYGIGWERSIAEIFAEDYTQVNLPSAGYKIRWLGRPPESVVNAIRADLGPNAGTPSTAPPPPGQAMPGEPPPGSSTPAGTPPGLPGGQPGPGTSGPLPKFARSRFAITVGLRPRKAKTYRIPVASVRRVRIGVKVIQKRGKRPAVATLRCNGRTLDTRAGVARLRPGRARVVQARRATPGVCILRVKAGKKPVGLRIVVKKIRTA